ASLVHERSPCAHPAVFAGLGGILFARHTICLGCLGNAFARLRKGYVARDTDAESHSIRTRIIYYVPIPFRVELRKDCFRFRIARAAHRRDVIRRPERRAVTIVFRLCLRVGETFACHSHGADSSCWVLVSMPSRTRTSASVMVSSPRRCCCTYAAKLSPLFARS